MWRAFLMAVFVVVLLVEWYVRMGVVDWSAVELGELPRPKSFELVLLLVGTYPWSIGTGLACAVLAWLPGRFLGEPSPR
jgi:hypothetical protein